MQALDQVASSAKTNGSVLAVEGSETHHLSAQELMEALAQHYLIFYS